MRRSEIVCLGQLAAVRNRPDAHLYLLKPQGWDYKLIRFASRAALEAFNKRANLEAVIKTSVPKNCVLYRHQEEE